MRRAKSGASRRTRRCARPATARRSRTAFARSIGPASSRSSNWAPSGSRTRSGKDGGRCRRCPRRACRRRPWRRCSPTSRIRPPRPGRRGFRRRCRSPPSTSATPVRSARPSATTSGTPVLGPPWARIVAYDLNAGTIKWAAPLGTVPALAAKGVTDTGNDSRIHRNGLVVTAGGLVFVGILRRSHRPRVRQGHGPHPVGAPAARASRGDAGGLRGGRTPVRGVLREHAAGRRRGVGPGLLRLRPGPWPALTARDIAAARPAAGGWRNDDQIGSRWRARGVRRVAALACVLVADVAGQAPPPVPSISQRPTGASLGTIRVGAADDNIWFGWRVGVPSTAIARLDVLRGARPGRRAQRHERRGRQHADHRSRSAEAARPPSPGRGAERGRASAAGAESAGAGLSRR